MIKKETSSNTPCTSSLDMFSSVFLHITPLHVIVPLVLSMTRISSCIRVRLCAELDIRPRRISCIGICDVHARRRDRPWYVHVCTTQAWYRTMHHQLGITRVSLLLAPTPCPRASPTRPNVGGGRHAITYYHYCGIVPPPSRGEGPSSRDTPIHVRLTLGVGSCPPVVVLLHRLLRNLEHIRVNARATRKNAKQRRNEIRNTKRRRKTGTHRQPDDVRRQRRTRRNDKHRPQTRRVRIARLALERVGEGFDEAERVPDGGDDLFFFFRFS